MRLFDTPDFRLTLTCVLVSYITQHPRQILQHFFKNPQNFDYILTYAGDAVVVDNAFGEEPVPDLPGEDGGALALVVRYLGHDGRSRHTRL